MYSRAEERATTAARVEDAGGGFEIKFLYYTLTEPVGGIILAQRMASIEVNKFLIDPFENIFVHMSKIIGRDFLCHSPKDRFQFMEIFTAMHPMKEIIIDKVSNIIAVKHFAIEYFSHLIIVHIVVIAEYFIS